MKHTLLIAGLLAPFFVYGQPSCDDTTWNGGQVSMQDIADRLGVTCTDDPPPPTPTCSDGLDNDGDDYIDFGVDPDCTSADDDEDFFDQPPVLAQCEDGADNDADGLVDLSDPGCSSASDDDETDPPPTTGDAVTLEWDVSTFVAVNGGTESSLFSVTAIDVDRDGDMDILGGDHYAGANHVFLENDGAGNFTLSFFSAGRCSLTAWNADGDWACRDNDGADPIHYLPNFTQDKTFCGNGPNVVGVADFNGDGWKDCVNASGEVWDFRNGPTLLQDAPGTARGAADFASGAVVVTDALVPGFKGSATAHSADYDGDGNNEFFIVSNDIPAFYDEQFNVLATLPDTDLRSYGNAKPGDFDNDGDVDIIFSKSGSTAYRLYINEGGMSFSAFTAPGFADSGNGWTVGRMKSTVGDFNGDGIDDFAIIARPGNGATPVEVRVFINKGITNSQAGNSDPKTQALG